MKRLLPFLALLCLGATCERKAEQRIVVQEERVESADASVTVEVERESKKVTGPVEIVTITEDYFPPTPCDALRCPDPGTVNATPVPKRKVTQTVKRQPVVQDASVKAQATARASMETHEELRAVGEDKVETARVAGPPWYVWLWVPLGILALLAGGMYLKQRFNLWS